MIRNHSIDAANSHVNLEKCLCYTLPMLTLVSTPIGNLGDISQRALDALSAADLVICEDTRKTGFLLKHFGISKPMLTFRVDNEKRALPRILNLLEEGKSVALVTDSGTPGISDPGFLVVRDALEKGFEVNAVPGASAFVMALTLSGLPTSSFTFRGFPPHKSGPRKRFFEGGLTLSAHTGLLRKSLPAADFSSGCIGSFWRPAGCNSQRPDEEI